MITYFAFAMWMMGALTVGCAVGILIMVLCTVSSNSDDYISGWDEGYSCGCKREGE